MHAASSTHLNQQRPQGQLSEEEQMQKLLPKTAKVMHCHICPTALQNPCQLTTLSALCTYMVTVLSAYNDTQHKDTCNVVTMQLGTSHCTLSKASFSQKDCIHQDVSKGHVNTVGHCEVDACRSLISSRILKRGGGHSCWWTRAVRMT